MTAKEARLEAERKIEVVEVIIMSMMMMMMMFMMMFMITVKMVVGHSIHEDVHLRMRPKIYFPSQKNPLDNVFDTFQDEAERKCSNLRLESLHRHNDHEVVIKITMISS